MLVNMEDCRSLIIISATLCRLLVTGLTPVWDGLQIPLYQSAS